MDEHSEQEEPSQLVGMTVVQPRDILLPLHDRAVQLEDIDPSELQTDYFRFLDSNWFGPLFSLHKSFPASLVLLTVCFSLFELYEQLYTGESNRNRVAEFVRRGARRVLDGQMTATMSEGERREFAQRFTQETRNSLIHHLIPRDMAIVFDGEDEGGFSMGDPISSDWVGVDPFWLLGLIQLEFRSYQGLLSTDSERRQAFTRTALRIVEDVSFRD